MPAYLRVVDLEFGADARDGEWEERTAGALLAAPDAEDLVLFDREQRLFKTVVAAPLGHLQPDGKFRKPKTLPGHFCPVRRPAKGDFRFLAPQKGDLELGFLRSGDEALPDRLGLEEARSFATLIQQSAELGSSITEALRVYSDDMRHKRLSRAEEKAYSLPAKLSLPMMMCIFPVIFVVILLPVFVRLYLGLY